jgi:hypothetical protein
MLGQIRQIVYDYRSLDTFTPLKVVSKHRQTILSQMTNKHTYKNVYLLKIIIWICDRDRERDHRNRYILTSYGEYFIDACSMGLIHVAKRMSREIDIARYCDEAFRVACANGHVNIASWLYRTNTRIDIHQLNDYVFRISCQRNHLEMAQWIYMASHENINTHILTLGITTSYRLGYLAMSQWLNEITK